jgi:hypothetical protein
MDKTTRLNLMIAFTGVLLALLSLGWQVFDKIYSSSERLQSKLVVVHSGALKVEVVNVGPVNAYIEVQYLHLSTENGKGYGFYFDDSKEIPRLLAPNEKATFVCRALENWQVTAFIAPQRVRRAEVVVRSSREVTKVYNLASAEWKKKLRSLYGRSMEKYDEVTTSHVYAQVDFRSMTINGVTQFMSEFHMSNESPQLNEVVETEKPSH